MLNLSNLVAFETGRSISVRNIAASYIYASGENTDGQLGIGDNDSVDEFHAIGFAPDWRQYGGGLMGFTSFAINRLSETFVTGANEDGCMGIGIPEATTASFNTLQPVPGHWKMLTNGADENGANAHSVGIKTDGTLWAAGNNDRGQLGTGNTISTDTFVQIGSSSNWVKVACGAEWTVASNTADELYSWGSGDDYRTGQNTQSDTLSPTSIHTGVLDFAAGSNCGFLIHSDNLGESWGSNSDGRTCRGTIAGNTQEPSPMNQNVNAIYVAIAANAAGGWAVDANNDCWGWGLNNLNQVGDGTTTNRLIPVEIGASIDWTDAVIVGGSEFALAIIGGDLYGWGRGISGQFGQNNSLDIAAPLKLFDTEDYVALGTCFSSSYVVRESKTAPAPTPRALFVWGWNQHGALMSGDSVQVTTPTIKNVGEDFLIRHGAGLYGQGLLIGKGTNLVAAGRNDKGQLGLDNTTSPVTGPTTVTGFGSSAMSTAPGYNMSALVTATGEVYTSGSVASMLANGETATDTFLKVINNNDNDSDLTGKNWISVGSKSVMAIGPDDIHIWGVQYDDARQSGVVNIEEYTSWSNISGKWSGEWVNGALGTHHAIFFDAAGNVFTVNLNNRYGQAGGAQDTGYEDYYHCVAAATSGIACFPPSTGTAAPLNLVAIGANSVTAGTSNSYYLSAEGKIYGCGWSSGLGVYGANADLDNIVGPAITEFVQMGTDTNWIRIEGTPNGIIAQKNTGLLFFLGYAPQGEDGQGAGVANYTNWTQIGTNRYIDWQAIGRNVYGVV